MERTEGTFLKENSNVRRCPHCLQPSAVLIIDWQDEVYGIKTGVATQEYRCQSCGKRFKIHAKRENTILLVLGIALLFFMFPAGLLLLFIARRRWKLAARAPLLPDARIPAIRYQEGPPRRRCGACGNLCRAVRVARESHNGIPMGMEIEYECSGCGRQFTIGSTGSNIGLGFTALFFLAAGAALWFFLESMWKYAGMIASAAFGLLMAYDLAKRISADRANPELPELR